MAWSKSSTATTSTATARRYDGGMTAPSARLSRSISLAWLLGFVVFMAAIAAALFYARSQALATLNDDDSRGKWREWQDEVKRQQQSKTSPVQRRVTNSDEPPTLVMLRDSFPAIILVCLLAGALFYLFLAYLARGMWHSRVRSDSNPRVAQDAADPPAGAAQTRPSP